MSGFSAAIFDLDGVLVDTAELHYLGWKRLADEIGVSFDRAKNERLKGVPRMESLRIILEDLAEPPKNLDELADRKNGYYVEMIRSLTPKDLLPGARDFLLALRRRGVKVGVASSSKNAKPVIENLKIGPLLDAVTDGHDFENAKPAPDVFLICAQRLASRPEQCAVFEDAQAGVEAARAAGMFAIGVCSHGQTLQGADLLVRQASQAPLSLFCGVG